MKTNNASILIVDDNVSNLKVLLTLLQDHGYSVRIAESAERALQVLDKFSPDCLLLDIMMPGMDGFDLCRKLQKDPETSKIPILFMSALDAVQDKIEGFEAGCVDYITKPFQELELLARVKIHITLRRQKQELEQVQEELLHQKTKLELLSITDDLTGLHNRRCLNMVMEREFLRGIRHESNLSCLALDLDHFKRVNDTHGHEVGDTVLQTFSTLLVNSIRSTDFSFRIGGEEFIVLLPETDVDGARQTAEKIRKRMEEKSFTGVDHRVTVSIGICSIKEHLPGDSGELLNFADKALYTAKQGGRNRTRTYDDTRT